MYVQLVSMTNVITVHWQTEKYCTSGIMASGVICGHLLFEIFGYAAYKYCCVSNLPRMKKKCKV